ncbi:MAG: hypothetical protein WC750_06615 [Patescibacteria group bacterium]|jgi:hypothetical protein
MAQTDLDNIETAIRAIIAGTRSVSWSMGDKSMTFTAIDLPTLQKLRDTIKYEVGLAAGSYFPRTYAKQGGRC